VILVRSARLFPSRCGVLRAIFVAFALLATSLLGVTAAPAQTACTSPPTVYPESQLAVGQIATGSTTIQGTTPTSFTVEILGTIPDGIMLGIDLIVGQITGPQSFLDETGGVFFGISGSPLYTSGKFVGTTSYGFWADPTIVGITPGQAVVDVLSYERAAPKPARRIAVTDEARRAIARATGKAVAEVTGSFEPIPAPLGVSGLSGKRLADFQTMVDEQGANVKVFSSGSVAAPTAVSATPFVPGAPIGSVLSYGDATIWAMGTASVVCGDEVIAYGHSLFWDPPGSVTIGMTGANVMTILHTTGYIGEMLGNVTDTRGTFTQDRYAGEVGAFGVLPPTTPITTTFTSPDTGLTRTGSSYSVYQADPYWFIDTAWAHLFMNLAAVFQRVGDGTSSIDYTIEGTTEDGTPFTLTNRGMFYSDWDAAMSAYKLVETLYALSFNRFTTVTFTDVSATGDITEQDLTGDIVKVRTKSSLQPTLKARSLLKAKPGDTVTVEVTLAPVEGGANQTATMSFKVPKSARGKQRVTLRGGHDRYYFSQREVGSFDELLARLSNGEHGNDLILSEFGTTKSFAQDLIVDGKGAFTLQVVR
jgi:hypothetical protein